MTSAAAPREFLELSLDLIDDPLLPSRTSMDDAQLDDLVESIRAIGLQQPMVVARVADRYEIIAGHRRRIACQRAGLASAPCLVYPSKDVIPTKQIQAHENSRREALNPADEAIWFADLLESVHGDIEKLCGLVGEKLSYVDNRLALFRGDEAIFAALQKGEIKIGVAHELNKCPDQKYRRYYLHCAIQGGASVNAVVGWIQEWRTLFAEQPHGPAASEPAAPGMSAEPVNPFTCEICGRADNVHLIRQINVHQHCKLAILDPLLASARGEA